MSEEAEEEEGVGQKPKWLVASAADEVEEFRRQVCAETLGSCSEATVARLSCDAEGVAEQEPKPRTLHSTNFLLAPVP